MIYSTSAIVLRRRDIGEWDRLYTVYTLEHGKLVLVGKGTRRPKAKLASHLEPLSEVDLTIARGRAIDRVAFARVLWSGAAIAGSFERLRVAMFIAECADQLVGERHRDPALYDCLRESLAIASAGDASVLLSAFSLRILSILGYRPQLDRCLECRSSVSNEEPLVGIPNRGGLFCARCGMSARSGIPLASDDRRQLTDGSASLRALSFSSASQAYIAELLNAHLFSPLRTMSSAYSLTRDEASATLVAS
ncbi:MAG: DNA repair protein RecO [Candidatus Uhrbacteria bacterium]